MSQYTLFPVDTYVVINKAFLHEQDEVVLNMLYMPIIGANAITLYMTLYREFKLNSFITSELTHHHLMSILGFNTNLIKEARIKRLL